MKKNLLLVNTYFQLITSINLVLNHFKDDLNDLIITDRSVNMNKIVDKLKDYKIFINIFYIESNELCNQKNKIKKYLIYLFNRKKLIGTKINEKYDYLLFFNYDLLTYSIFDELNTKNKNLICKRYDEGFVSYIKEIKNNKVNQLIRKICFKRNIEKSIESIYLYHPDLICYGSKCKTEVINLLDKGDKKLKQIYNSIFNYENDEFEPKYIFFEESFFCDNKGVEDLELILSIADIVGKKNLLVKLHPRNKVDRFKKYGIKTNKTVGIPWEVIQMNNDFSNKVFLTISSGSVLASKLYFNDNIKTYLLFNCTEKMSDMVTNEYFKYLDQIRDKFGMDNFIIPSNKEEFFENLRKEVEDDRKSN